MWILISFKISEFLTFAWKKWRRSQVRQLVQSAKSSAYIYCLVSYYRHKNIYIYYLVLCLIIYSNFLFITSPWWFLAACATTAYKLSHSHRHSHSLSLSLCTIIKIKVSLETAHKQATDTSICPILN